MTSCSPEEPRIELPLISHAKNPMPKNVTKSNETSLSEQSRNPDI